MTKATMTLLVLITLALTGCQSLKRRQAATEAPPPATLRHKAFRPFAPPPVRPQPPAFDDHDPLFGDPDVGNGFSPPAPAKPKSPVRQKAESEYVREPMTTEEIIGGILVGIAGIGVLVRLGRGK